MLKHCIYSNPYFWIKKIQDETDIWNGIFDNIPLNRNSIIIAPTIENSYTNINENRCSIYPNIYSVLGFLSYMYLPTVRKNILTSSFDYDYTFVLNELLEIDMEMYPEKVRQVERLQHFYEEAQQQWYKKPEHSIEGVKRWSVQFNEDWEEQEYLSHSVSIFTSPIEAVQYLINLNGNNLDINLLENELEMTYNDFLNLQVDELYENEWLNRRTTNILANRLPVTV